MTAPGTNPTIPGASGALKSGGLQTPSASIALGGNEFAGKLYSALEIIGNAYESIKEGSDSYKKDGDVYEVLRIIFNSFFKDIVSGEIADKIIR